ncbi:MAG: ABC transporter permease [Lachnospiraceae bacterium]
MSRFFYGKLAVENLRKNKSLYLPYLITAMGMSAVFYIMLAITMDEGIQKMPGADELQLILGLGSWVVGIFFVIFLLYTNSFLMKRRKKEFGLFNILGMEKRHIGKMMFWETSLIAGFCIISGILFGILLNKLMVLILLRITHLKVSFGFSISITAISITAVLFAVIFVVTLLYNLQQVQKAKPIELLKSANQGEAEPKTRWLLTVIGLLSLAGGYYIAITTKDPMSALLLFFVAVIMVMIGTYCLFTSGSIALLKMLRRNKNYYYKTNHFTSVSGMIYRMKQNAVGLANICILSTAVLVMISGTISLYAGMNDIMNNRFPKDISIRGDNIDQEQKTDIMELIKRSVEESNLTLEEMESYEVLSFSALKNEETINILQRGEKGKGKMCFFSFITLKEYEQATGKSETLKEDEILIFSGQKQEKIKESNIIIEDKILKVKKQIQDMGETLTKIGSIYACDIYFIILKDRAVLESINSMQKEVYQEQGSNIGYEVYLNVSGTQKEEKECIKKINHEVNQYTATQISPDDDAWIGRIDSKEESREQFYIFYGGFLFLGIFLGFVFLMATVLIIYYKQISEGFEDKERFTIMQKVGMSHKEVKASIRNQIIKVFFLPLVMACIHLMAAFPLVNRLLALLGMSNIGLFAVCSLITVGMFTGIYGIVYAVTAKAYYKIVG